MAGTSRQRQWQDERNRKRVRTHPRRTQKSDSSQCLTQCATKDGKVVQLWVLGVFWPLSTRPSEFDFRLGFAAAQSSTSLRQRQARPATRGCDKVKLPYLPGEKGVEGASTGSRISGAEA